MEALERLLSVAFVLSAGALAIILGIAASVKCFGGRVGFRHGAALGGIFTFLASVMVGYLVAGRMEETIGTNFGVPVGLAMGCFSGAFAANSFFGGTGAVVAKVFGGE